jgi:type VI secretion system secreted protein Hcp
MKKNRHYQFLLIFLVCVLAAVYVKAQDQPVIAYVTIQGTKTGAFKGSATIKGRQGQIECIGFTYAVTSPHDANTGQTSGRRQESPFVIVKHIDGASPELLQAAYTNEVLKTVTIEFTRGGGSGKNDIYQSIRLTNVTISRVSQYGGTTSPDKLIPNNNPFEEIAFVFQKIEVSNVESKTTAADDWTAN